MAINANTATGSDLNMPSEDAKKAKGKIMKVISPLSVVLPRRTKANRRVIINLNNYRNWHYIISNEVKVAYVEAIKDQLEGMRFKGKLKLHFVLFKGSKRTSDRANVLSIHEKFFCDALTHCGCIDDDNDTIIEETHYSSGGIDKENPRVEIIITSTSCS